MPRTDRLMGILEGAHTAQERASILLTLCRLLKQSGFRYRSTRQRMPYWINWLQQWRKREMNHL